MPPYTSENDNSISGLQQIQILVDCPHCTKNVKLSVTVHHPDEEANRDQNFREKEKTTEFTVDDDAPDFENPSELNLQEVSNTEEIEKIVKSSGFKTDDSVTYKNETIDESVTIKTEIPDDDDDDECLITNEEYSDNWAQQSGDNWNYSDEGPSSSMLQRAARESLPMPSFQRQMKNPNMRGFRSNIRGGIRSRPFPLSQNRPSMINRPSRRVAPQIQQMSPLRQAQSFPQTSAFTPQYIEDPSAPLENQNIDEQFSMSASAASYSGSSDGDGGGGMAAVGSPGVDKGLYASSMMDPRPFLCTQCDGAFKYKSNLNQHIKIVHKKETRFECQMCGKRCFFKSDFLVHKCIKKTT